MATKFLTGIDVNSQRVTSVASPSSGTDATNKNYVDNKIDGLAYKEEVRAATTTNGTLSSAYANGQTVDGITLATSDRILIKNQTDAKENGIYVVTAGTPTRATDADSTADLNNATVYVTDGTANGGKEYTQTTKSPVIATDNIVWVQKTTGTTYTAGSGLTESPANTFNVSTGTASATGLEINSGNVRIASAAAGAGLTGGGGAALDVGAGTGITVNASDVAVNTSVVATKYATTIGDGSTTSFAISHNLPGGRDVIVGIYEAASPWTEVYADVVHTSTTQVTVTFATAPSTNQYKVVVIG